MAERYIYWWGEWWGSVYCLVRCERPTGLPHQLRQTEKIAKAIDAAKAQLPGKSVQFGPPQPGSEGKTVLPLTLLADWAIDKAYLDWAERYVHPERWAQVAIRGGDAVAILGFRDDEKEPVAMIAGRKA